MFSCFSPSFLAIYLCFFFALFNCICSVVFPPCDPTSTELEGRLNTSTHNQKTNTQTHTNTHCGAAVRDGGLVKRSFTASSGSRMPSSPVRPGKICIITSSGLTSAARPQQPAVQQDGNLEAFLKINVAGKGPSD